MPDHETVLAFESDMAAAKRPFYARLDEINAWHFDQICRGDHDGTWESIRRLTDERNAKARALAAEFAPVFAFI